MVSRMNELTDEKIKEIQRDYHEKMIEEFKKRYGAKITCPRCYHTIYLVLMDL